MIYLDRLNLDVSADARAIRRAYARELKLIDQETEPAAFQVLREAYEQALRWVADGEQPPSEQSPDDLPYQNALAQLQDLKSFAQAQQFLQELRPENLAESEEFEAAVAGMLEQGWRPGHEYLFPAACDIFYWNGRQLPSYLEELDALVGAIGDLKFLHMQPEEVRFNHQRVIDSLCSVDMPNLADLARDILLAEFVSTKYPDLMHLTCAPRKTAAWREQMGQLVKQVKERELSQVAESESKKFRRIHWIFLAWTSAWIYMGATNFDLLRGKEPVRQLTVMEMNWITKNVEPILTEIPVEYEVSLGDSGDVDKLDLVGSPNGKAANEVAHAIRVAAPYPADYPRSFRVKFPI